MELTAKQKLKGVCSYCQSVHPVNHTVAGYRMKGHFIPNTNQLCDGCGSDPEFVMDEKGYKIQREIYEEEW